MLYTNEQRNVLALSRETRINFCFLFFLFIYSHFGFTILRSLFLLLRVLVNPRAYMHVYES